MIEFISYNGTFPYYCQGTLILRIDGELVRFGEDIDDIYESFWVSGGEAHFDKQGGYHIFKRPWIVERKFLPIKYQPYAEEIERIINLHMRWGCCGGCLHHKQIKEMKEDGKE